MACLNIVIIDGLLAKEGKLEVMLVYHCLEDLRNSKWLELLVNARICHDMDALVSTHREGVTDHIDRSAKD